MTRVLPLIIVLAGFCLSSGPSLTKEQEAFLNHRRTPKQFSESLEFVNDGLDGYRTLTALILEHSNLQSDYNIHVVHQNNIPEDASIRAVITGKQLRACKGIGWESQYLGLYNHAKGLGYHFELQQYDILKLKLEIATLKAKPHNQIDRLKREIEATERHLLATYFGEDKWHD